MSLWIYNATVGAMNELALDDADGSPSIPYGLDESEQVFAIRQAIRLNSWNMTDVIQLLDEQSGDVVYTWNHPNTRHVCPCEECTECAC